MFSKGLPKDAWQRSETHFRGTGIGWVPTTLQMRPHWSIIRLLYTSNEISNIVFQKKSSIVKGLVMRSSSSLKTTTSSSSSVQYI